MNRGKRVDILERRSEIEKWIEEGQTKEYISMRLKCSNGTLKRYFAEMNIDYKGKPGFGMGHKRLTAYEYSQKEYGVSSDKLRIKLIDEGIKEGKCEKCGVSEWMQEPISLELHHIDDNHYNNNFDNLQILCPNCHSQTKSYRRSSHLEAKKYCLGCKKKIYYKSKSNKCKKCFNANHPSSKKYKIDWPPVDKLIEMVKCSSYTGVGRELGVSRSSVTRHIDKHKLKLVPTPGIAPGFSELQSDSLTSID